MSDNEHATAEMRRIIDNQARSLAAADVEMRRLYAELDASRTALDDAVGALLMERAVSERARVYMLYTEAAYPGDEHQIEMLVKWIEACKKRGEG